ncbi:MAG: hypothetical protein P8I56_19430 [Paracoccaceae bacterium]|nr:hypothetical protein [Paracoccaceae bacterium]
MKEPRSCSDLSPSPPRWSPLSPSLVRHLRASDLAVELKQLARAEQGKVSPALSNISYNDALYLLDELNHADYRRLSQAMVSGRLHLPRNIRNALEVKAPRLNQRGSGR